MLSDRYRGPLYKENTRTANSGMTSEQIVNLLPGLKVETAGVYDIQDMFTAQDEHRGSHGSATKVAFVSAR